MKRLLLLLLTVMLTVTFMLPLTAQAASSYDYVKVTHSNVPVRYMADKDTSQIGKVNKGEMYRIESIAIDDRSVIWYMVTAGNNTGWISSNLCELRSCTQLSSVSGTKVNIVNGNVNVRSFPDTESRSLGTAYKGETLTYGGVSVEDSRGVVWHKVSGKLNGWVSSKFSRVSNNSANSGSSSSGSSSGDTVLVTGGTVNVRYDADADAGKICTVKKGASFTYEGSKKDSKGTTWYKIFVNGGYGYISSKYSKLTSSNSSPAYAYKLLTVDGGAKVNQSGYVKNNKPAVDGSKAFDGKTNTAWNVNGENHSIYQWVEITAKKECTVNGVTIVTGYDKISGGTDAWENNSRAKELLVTCDGNYVMYITLKDTREPQTFTFYKPFNGKTFRFEIVNYYQGDKYDDVCISDISFF